MPHLRDSLFLRRWPSRDAALAAVVAHTVDRGVVYNHGTVDVGVVDDGRIHIQNRGVIAEDTPVPAAAAEAGSEVSEPIVDAAIKADLRGPIALVKEERIVFPAPPGRSP